MRTCLFYSTCECIVKTLWTFSYNLEEFYILLKRQSTNQVFGLRWTLKNIIGQWALNNLLQFCWDSSKKKFWVPLETKFLFNKSRASNFLRFGIVLEKKFVLSWLILTNKLVSFIKYENHDLARQLKFQIRSSMRGERLDRHCVLVITASTILACFFISYNLQFTASRKHRSPTVPNFTSYT